jgi:Zn-dependent peptidase ImmA (M78 family)
MTNADRQALDSKLSVATRARLSKQGAYAAFMTRKRLGFTLNDAFCVYDAADADGLVVRFHAIPSLEGMYVKGDGVDPHIVVSALRPPGRQAMTAAHEWGHHYFDHGSRVDEYLLPSAVSILAQSTSRHIEEEFLANSFAAFLLMPPPLVQNGFRKRHAEIRTATPLQVFAVAGWLGVGYTSLVRQLRHNLRMISFQHAQALLASKPQALKTQLLEERPIGDVYLVDESWTGRPVDLRVGDLAIVPTGTIAEHSSGRLADLESGPAVIEQQNSLTYARAVAPGLGRIVGDNWASFVRVSEREFEGLNLYRHLPRDD